MTEQVYTCSPGDLLASFLSKTNHKRELYLLAGISGSGKTTWCLDFVKKARQSGLKVSGLLSPAVFDGNQKTGIDLLNLANQEVRHLAYRPSSYQGEAGQITGAWCLDQDTLTWGNQCLRQLGDADILILDELGPLEFLQEKGLTAGIQLIDADNYRLAIVTIRLSLLDNARQRWPNSRVIEPCQDENVRMDGS